MTDNEPKYPQFIRMDSEIKTKYLDEIKSTDLFSKKEATDVYFICAALGFKHSLKKESVGKLSDLRLYETIQPKYKSLIRLMALKDQEYDYSVLTDGKKMLKIVESYANGGASMLYDKVLQSGLDLSIEDEIWEEVKDKAK